MDTATEPGCWIDGSHGQYAGYVLAEITDARCGTNFCKQWPRDEDGNAIGTYGRTGSPWAGISHGDYEIEIMVEIMDECELLLNETAPEGFYFGWSDGDFGLYPYEDE